jgi:NitT/TauT family transport system substrate-binding protein
MALIRHGLKVARAELLVASGIWLLLFLPCAAPAQPIKIRAVYPSVDVQYLPAYVGQMKGFFRQEDIDLELIVVRGGPTGVQALVGGDVNFIMQMGAALPAIWSGADLKIVAQMTNMLLFSLIVRPDIHRVEDLRGKRIGVSVGATTAAVVSEFLKQHDLDPDKAVEFVNIPGSTAKIAALQAGLIAAAPVAPPGEFKALQAGFRRLVFFGNVLPETSFTGLMARTRFLKESPNAVQKMVRALARATFATRDEPVTAISVMEKKLGMTPFEAKETYDLIGKSFSPFLTESAVQSMAGLVARSGGLKPTKQAREYIDFTFVNHALADLARTGR